MFKLLSVFLLAAAPFSGVPAHAKVPTPAEAELKSAESGICFGVFVPAKTPAAIIEKLRAAGVKVLSDPATQENLKKLGIEAMPMSPAGMDGLIKHDTASNLGVIRAAGIQQ
jgi:tripartite-type tricarboxylate transporter receptor subunit TctC